MKKLGGVVAAIVLVLGVILTAKSLVKVPAGYVAASYRLIFSGSSSLGTVSNNSFCI